MRVDQKSVDFLPFGFASLFLLMRGEKEEMSGLERLISAQFVPLVEAKVKELGCK